MAMKIIVLGAGRWIGFQLSSRCRLAGLQLFALLLCRESLRKLEILEFGSLNAKSDPFGPSGLELGLDAI
jgi:hypothetical protein